MVQGYIILRNLCLYGAIPFCSVLVLIAFFLFLHQIGSGTYSNVYKAIEINTGQVVAMKKVRFEAGEKESIRFMAREIEVLRRLGDHPNIVKFEGVVVSRVSQALYLVFEYMEHDLAGLAAAPGTNFSEPQVIIGASS
jgi:cyclin-dependent kinase 12/13